MKQLVERLESQVSDARQLTEETKLGPKDKKVIRAFTDHVAGESKKLSTDGKRLDGLWMGGRDIAHWKGSQIIFNDLGSKAAQTVQRQIKKMVPNSWIVEDEESAEDNDSLEEKYGKGYGNWGLVKFVDLILKMTEAGMKEKEITSFLMKLGATKQQAEAYMNRANLQLQGEDIDDDDLDGDELDEGKMADPELADFVDSRWLKVIEEAPSVIRIAFEKIKKDPKKYAPQWENVLTGLRGIQRSASVAIRQIEKRRG